MQVKRYNHEPKDIEICQTKKINKLVKNVWRDSVSKTREDRLAEKLVNSWVGQIEIAEDKPRLWKRGNS